MQEMARVERKLLFFVVKNEIKNTNNNNNDDITNHNHTHNHNQCE